MADERIVEVERPSGGGVGWLVAIILAIGLVVGGIVLANRTDSAARKDNAIAQAAHDIGSAADKAGDAAQKAGDASARKTPAPN